MQIPSWHVGQKQHAPHTHHEGGVLEHARDRMLLPGHDAPDPHAAAAGRRSLHTSVTVDTSTYASVSTSASFVVALVAFQDKLSCAPRQARTGAPRLGQPVQRQFERSRPLVQFDRRAKSLLGHVEGDAHRQKRFCVRVRNPMHRLFDELAYDDGRPASKDGARS